MLIKRISILTFVLIFVMILSMGVTFANKSPGSIHLVLSNEDLEGNNPLFENKSSVFVSLSNFMPGTYDVVVKAPGSKGTILGTEKIEIDSSGSLLFNLYELIPFDDTDNEAGVYTVVVDGNKLKNFKLETNEVDPDDPEEPSEQEKHADELIELGYYIPIANGDELNRIRNEYPEGELFGEGTKWERQYITRGVNSNYILVNNIDLSGFPNWVPLGDTVNRFAGNFDGNNYSISNLRVDATFDQVGLFGNSIGNIRSLRLIDPHVKGNNYVGALTGFHWQGTIFDVKIFKTTGSNPVVQGVDNVGGIAGYSRVNFVGKVFNEVNVIGNNFVGGIAGQYYLEPNEFFVDLYSSQNKGNVIGNDYVGGIVGYNKGVVNGVINEGNVTGRNNVGGVIGYSNGGSSYSRLGLTETVNIGYVKGVDYIGGLVGRLNYENMSNSYNMGIVEGHNYIGGIIGGTGSTNTVERVYASGLVIGNIKDGLVGQINELVLTDAYYNSDLSDTYLSGIGASLTNEEMTNPIYFNNYDFSNEWSIVSGETYPYLKWHEEFYIPLKINLD